MNAGFQVIGASGVIQIDQYFSNLALIAKGTLTLGPGTPPFGAFGEHYSCAATVNLSTDLEFPIIAIKSTDAAICLAQWSSTANSGGVSTQWTAGFYAKYDQAGKSFTYYIFDRPKPIASTGGLEIFDGDSKLLFNSNYKYLKIAAIATYQYSEGPKTVSLPAGREYAAVIVAPCRTALGYKLGDNTLMDDRTYFGTVMTSSSCIISNVTTSHTHIASTGPAAYTNTGMVGSMLIADVTNF